MLRCQLELLVMVEKALETLRLRASHHPFQIRGLENELVQLVVMELDALITIKTYYLQVN